MNDDSLRKHITIKYNSGIEIENNFNNIAVLNGFQCIHSTKSQDINEHWDFKLIKNNISEYVDVKGMKDVHNLGYTWIELKNVLGYAGWLYADKLDAVVFEKKDSFDFIKITDLRTLVANKIVNKNGLMFIKPNNINEMLYHRYNRLGRNDVIVLASFEDIDKYVYRSFKKIMK